MRHAFARIVGLDGAQREERTSACEPEPEAGADRGMRFACEPEERRVLVGGDPQPERHLLAVLFGRDACVVEAVEPLLRIAVLETEGEPLRLGVAVKWKAASG